MLVLLRRGQWRLTLLAVTVILLAVHVLYSPSICDEHPWPDIGAGWGHASSLLERQQQFWRLLHTSIRRHAPQCPSMAHSEVHDLGIRYNRSGTTPGRPDRLNVSTTQVLELRSKHQAFAANLQHRQYTLPFIPGTRGIVTTAGGKYLPVAVVSVRMLRETGSTLPVEVFVATQDEWDSEICDYVLPRLNTRCVVLGDIFDPFHQNESLEIAKYQYKIMSLIFSSFEEVLFLDSDCFPIYDPAQYFESDLFLQTGMILWPDFWYPSESPSFFEIADIPIPELGSWSATESGELFYSKPRHTNSLLLAMYYNYYGPDFYYPLQSQGAPGEGDKETFLWAAVVFDEPFYTVRQPVKAMGYMTTDGEWRGSAMVQFNPVDDIDRQRQVEAYGEEKADLPVRPLFVHANMPKIDPGKIFLNLSFGATGPTRDADGTMRRIWHKTAQDSVDFFGFDVELRLWSIVKDIACECESTFMAWDSLENVCKHATDYWTALFEDKRSNVSG